MKNILSVIFAVLIFLSCGHQKTVSTIVGGDYDIKKDITSYFIIPYGSVEIPGKWDKTNYIKSSRQQFFKNEDDISLGIALGTVDKYEFNLTGELKGVEFIKAFYEWEKDYFEKQGLKFEIKEQDENIPFIIWSINGNIQDKKINMLYLISTKENGAFESYCLSSDKWDEKSKIDFLKRLLVKEKEKERKY